MERIWRGNTEGTNKTYLDDIRGNGGVVAVPVFHVPLEVDIEVFEDEVELLVCVHDVEKPGAFVKDVAAN